MTEPNNSFSQATDVSPDFYLQSNYFTNDSVSNSDPDDYFRFYNLYGSSNLYAALSGLSADADLYIYDDNYNEIARSTAGSNFSETINLSLQGNRYYYVRVNSFLSNNDTNYGLYLYNDYSGSALFNARNLGVSWGQSTNLYWPYRQVSWQDYLDFRDNIDVLRVIMEAPGTLSLRVMPFASNGNLQGSMQLLDINGSIISSISGNFSNGLTIDQVSLPANTYFVKYVQSSGSDTYSLRIVSDYGGDRTATARNVRTLSSNIRQFFDMVGNPSLPTYEDTKDLYKFTINQASQVDLRLNIDTDFFPISTFDANLSLAIDSNNDGFISNGEILFSATQLGSDRILTNLAANTYYVVVSSNRGAGLNYELQMSANDLGRIITGDANNNNLTGGSGDDSISGLGGNDTINGGSGNDTIIGGRGNDLVTGGNGRDAFRFVTPSDRLDRIGDFNGTAGDILHIEVAGFAAGLTRGVLGSSRFRSGSSFTTANTTSQRFIYNTTNGGLFFDANGSTGGINPVQITTLSGHPSLNANQIVVI